MISLLKHLKENKKLRKIIIILTIVVISSGILRLWLILNLTKVSPSTIIILSIVRILILLIASTYILTFFSQQYHLSLKQLKQLIDQTKAGHVNPQATTDEIQEEVSGLPQEFSKLLLNLKNEKDHLRKLAYTDVVTGSLNRHAFEESYLNLWQQAIGSGEPISVLLIDIDHFKGLNDQYGHHVGDLYLSKVSQKLNLVASEFDFFAYRYGGDEFIILADNMDAAKAAYIATYIHQHVARVNNSSLLMTHPITVSIGIADIIPTEHVDRNQVIRQADQALYKAKYQGRNHTIKWTEEESLV